MDGVREYLKGKLSKPTRLVKRPKPRRSLEESCKSLIVGTADGGELRRRTLCFSNAGRHWSALLLKKRRLLGDRSLCLLNACCPRNDLSLVVTGLGAPLSRFLGGALNSYSRHKLRPLFAASVLCFIETRKVLALISTADSAACYMYNWIFLHTKLVKLKLLQGFISIESSCNVFLM